jgi:hypothetical protein
MQDICPDIATEIEIIRKYETQSPNCLWTAPGLTSRTGGGNMAVWKSFHKSASACWSVIEPHLPTQRRKHDRQSTGRSETERNLSLPTKVHPHSSSSSTPHPRQELARLPGLLPYYSGRISQ